MTTPFLFYPDKPTHDRPEGKIAVHTGTLGNVPAQGVVSQPFEGTKGPTQYFINRHLITFYLIIYSDIDLLDLLFKGITVMFFFCLFGLKRILFCVVISLGAAVHSL